MPPEYVMEGAFSVKLDTYSFGVLLLEIVSGLKITSSQLVMNFVGLTAYAWRLWEDGKATELVHSSVTETYQLNEVLQCIHVGLLCVQGRPDDRPLMSSVIFMLENCSQHQRSLHILQCRILKLKNQERTWKFLLME